MTTTKLGAERPLPRALASHYPALDGVRGLAFLLVFFDHWSLVWGWKEKPHSVLETLAFKVADVGWCGVDLFFVMSGFLITGILLDTRGEWDYFSNFYKRRTLRIFPIYYAFLFLMFGVLRPLLAAAPGYHELASQQLWYWAYLQNWSTAIHGWPLVGVDHLWSLAVEEQFYMVWPLVVFFGGRGWTKRASIALVALAFALRLGLPGRPTFVYASTITRVDALAAGALIASIARESGGIERLRRAALPLMGIAVAGLAVLGVSCSELNKLDPRVETFGFSLFGALFSGVIMFVVTRRSDHRALRALATPRLRAVGRVSYAAYVVHYPGMRLVDAYLPASLSVHAKLGVGFVSSALLTVALSMASWRFVEKPLLRFKDHVSPAASTRRVREATSGVDSGG
jgi:peptidoglycan/LPS O-acetylase OafA/YrhL